MGDESPVEGYRERWRRVKCVNDIMGRGRVRHEPAELLPNGVTYSRQHKDSGFTVPTL